MAPRLRRHPERGASLVEFALLLPLFWMMVLGMFTGGQAYNQKNSINNGAREGARYGSTLAVATLTGPQWAAALKNTVLQRVGNDIDEAKTDQGICVALVRSDGSTVNGTYNYTSPNWTTGNGAPTAGGCYSDGLTDSSCRVHVMVGRKGEINALVFTYRPTMTAKGTARYERTGCTP